MRSFCSAGLCVTMLWVLGHNILYAAEIAIPASMDNTLYEDASGNTSNGAGQHFFAGLVGPTGSGAIRRGLIAFDVAGAIPPSSVITAASLQLTMNKTNFGAANVSLHRVNTSWGEGSSVAAGEEGQGAPAAANDATWTYRFFNTTSWAAPGGEFQGAASATQSVNAVGSYTWASTGMVADVQGWLDQPSTNFGWAVLGNEAAVSSSKRFASRQNSASASRPLLTLTYDIATGVKDWNLY